MSQKLQHNNSSVDRRAAAAAVVRRLGFPIFSYKYSYVRLNFVNIWKGVMI